MTRKSALTLATETTNVDQIRIAFRRPEALISQLKFEHCPRAPQCPRVDVDSFFDRTRITAPKHKTDRTFPRPRKTKDYAIALTQTVWRQGKASKGIRFEGIGTGEIEDQVRTKVVDCVQRQMARVAR